LKIIFDTNFLFIPFQFKVDIFEGIESVLETRVEGIVLSPVYDELRKMAKGGRPKIRKMAKLALELAERCHIIEVDRSPDKTIDDVIVEEAKKLGCIVATNDRALLRKLREQGIPRIYLRQRKKIVVEGFVY
jgi:hypothetical protein